MNFPVKIPVLDSFFFNADDFFSLLTSFRLLWGAGGFGSGKTALAVLVSAELVSRGLVARIHSNIDVGGKSPVLETVPDGQRYYSKNLRRWFEGGQLMPIEDASLLIDEAHLFLDEWGVAKDYVSALRKANLYMIMPSIWPVHVRLRALEVRRVMNYYAFGIPAWQYHWYLTNGQVAEQGKFFVWRPHRIFPAYNTAAFPEDDGGIAAMLRYTFNLEKERRQYGKSRSEAPSETRVGGAYAGSPDGIVSGIEAAIGGISDSIEYGQRFSNTKRKAR